MATYSIRINGKLTDVQPCQDRLQGEARMLRAIRSLDPFQRMRDIGVPS